jgi:hypothetical protein
MISHVLGVTSTLERKQSHTSPPLNNFPLLCHTTVLKHVVSSLADAERGAVFVNAKECMSRAQPFLKWATGKTPQNSKLTTRP